MSKRISKTAARYGSEQMAFALYNKKIEEQTAILNKRFDKVFSEIIPDSVRFICSIYQKFFECTRYVFAFYTFMNSQNHMERAFMIGGTLSYLIPYKSQYFDVGEKYYKFLFEEYSKLKKLNDECGHFRKEIYDAIIGLGTVSAIEKELPEVLQYLDISQEKKFPIPDLSGLKTKINILKNL